MSAVIYPDNIPSELRDRQQWVVWHYVDRGGPKPTKVPADPKTGLPANVTDSTTFGTFDQACHAHANGGCDGIGFVFTDSDPYTGIDLDDAGGDDSIIQVQNNIINGFASYTELSPSGTGVHIIVKGVIPHGRRRDKVEVYSNERYFTFTGNVIHRHPIAERQSTLDILFNQMGGSRDQTAGLQADRPVSQSDDEIIAALPRDPVMAARYNGDLSADAGDHSKADLALVNSLAVRCGNREQVERIWRGSPLAQRSKMDRRDYVQSTIERAFNRPDLPLVDTSNVTVNGQPLIAAGSTASMPAAPAPTVHDVGLWEGQTPPERDWMVPDWIAAREVVYLTSPGAAGKSLSMQQLCTSVAAGALWMGLPTARGVSLYVTCEDDPSELQRRQGAICQAMNIPLATLRGWFGVVSLTGALNSELATFDHQGRMTPTAAYHWLNQVIIQMSAKLVVLDNVAHLFSGNENIRNQVAAFLNLLTGLCKETGATIALIGHPNKSGEGYSGSTAWENQVRTRLFLGIPHEPDGTVRDPDARILTRAKANYGRAGETLSFRWHDGAFIREADIAELERGKIATQSQARFEDEAFLRCLAVCTQQKRNVSHSNGINYAPTIFTKMPEAGGLKKPAFMRAFERLNSLGIILLDQALWQRSNRAWVMGIKLAGEGQSA